jgi:hypothetical protein
MATTYIGIIREGKVEFDAPPVLPEGCQVRVTLSPLLSEREALGKANIWLANQVGDAVGAMNGVLIQIGHQVIWRFEAFITRIHNDPIGPIGQIEVNADTGVVLSTSQVAEAMVGRGRQLVPAS